MHCKNCKKEQETITIGGETYCATCSSLLETKNVPKKEGLKIPELKKDNNPIRAEVVKPEDKKVDAEIIEISSEAKIPVVSKDDLEGSAILLDILNDSAKQKLDEKTLTQDKKLVEATDEVLELIEKGDKTPVEKQETQKVARKGNGVMNDIVIGKRSDHLNTKHQTIAVAEREIKEEAQKMARIVTSEKGYTKEYDIIIMSIALTAAIFVILAIFMTFR